MNNAFFFEELKKINNHECESNDNDSETQECLITHDPLKMNHVTLDCGHKFNYDSIFIELLHQKGRIGLQHNYFEKVELGQIKCPYCRSITPKLLPYIGKDKHNVIFSSNGVNAPKSLCMNGLKCHSKKCNTNAFYEHAEKMYCFKCYNSILNPIQKCVAINMSGKNKGTCCSYSAIPNSTFCKKHEKKNCTSAPGFIE